MLEAELRKGSRGKGTKGEGDNEVTEQGNERENT